MSQPVKLGVEDSTNVIPACEDTAARDLRKATSISHCTTASAGSSHESPSVSSESQASFPELSLVKPDIENAQDEVEHELISIWTRRTMGITIGGFVLSFMNATCMAIAYGFFLGYMGLDSYVMSSITSLMKLPDVMLLPFGVISDCFPIRGQNRKPYFLAAWFIMAAALFAMSLRPQPAPFYCRHEDGSYNYNVPPCNPDIHFQTNWYVLPMFVLAAGVQMGTAAGEGLLLEYSLREPAERRGQIKAEMTMVCTAGGLAASLFVGIFMNGKEYLGTFDWGLSFSGLMTVCLILVACQVPITVFCLYEPPKNAKRISCRAHVKSSWHLVEKKALSSVLFFSFIVQFLVSLTTTALPMVKSQWAHVKVFQQQMFGMIGLAVMMVATWTYKVFFLQASWRKAVFCAIAFVTISDSIPSFLTVFGVIRNQYFYLGEDLLGAIPMAVLALLSNLIIIELAEPGREGLCYGLIGTFQHSSVPFATVISNQIYGSFKPSLSLMENYLTDTLEFRRTVAWSFVLSYSCSMTACLLLPMIPKQKEEAHSRKKEWGSNSTLAALVLGLPAICLIYGIVVLVLTSQPETACLRWIGGLGC